MKKLMTGYDAISYACVNNNVKFAAGSPVYPCIGIIQHIKNNESIYCELPINEKISFDAVVGASYAGKRSVLFIKNSGLNIAADSFYAISGSRINGGLVFFVCDDPGQIVEGTLIDSREYAFNAEIPLISPSNSQEVFDFMEYAFIISEKFHIPIFYSLPPLILQTRIMVNLSSCSEKITEKSFGMYRYFPKTVTGYIAEMGGGRLYEAMADAAIDVVKREQDILTYIEKFNINRVEYKRNEIGFICTGTSYFKMKETYPDASYLRLAVLWPLEINKIFNFFNKVKDVYVIEEGNNLVGSILQSLGFNIKEDIKGNINDNLNKSNSNKLEVNCDNCANKNVMQILDKMDVKVLGESTCLKFSQANNYSVFKGSGIGLEHGYSKAKNNEEQVVSVCSDYDFLHTGLNALMNVKQNNGKGVYIIFNNNCFKMIVEPNYKVSNQFNIQKFCNALKIECTCLNAYDLSLIEKVLESKLHDETPQVIVIENACERTVTTN